MTTREQLIKEIEQAPDYLVEELLDFLLFAKTRRNAQAASSTSANQSEQQAKPVWERFEEFADNLPEDIASKLPTDGASQLDHYLYGKPKSEL